MGKERAITAPAITFFDKWGICFRIFEKGEKLDRKKQTFLRSPCSEIWTLRVQKSGNLDRFDLKVGAPLKDTRLVVDEAALGNALHRNSFEGVSDLEGILV